MCSVTLLCVGKIRERYFAEAVAEYGKRLGAFCRFRVEELPEQRLGERPGPKEIGAALDREAEALEKRIPAGAAVAAFCVEGRLLSSEELSAQIDAWTAGGASSLYFVVGGSYGLSGSVKRRADLCLSMSRMTFPHHLFRVMAAEQLYRAFCISGGRAYHK